MATEAMVIRAQFYFLQKLLYFTLSKNEIVFRQEAKGELRECVGCCFLNALDVRCAARGN